MPPVAPPTAAQLPTTASDRVPALQQEGTARTFPPRGIPWRTLSAVGVVTAIGWVVPFAVGALGATLAAELRTSASGVGLAVAASFATTAIVSRPLGRRTARAPLRLLLLLACLWTSAALALVATVHSLAGLVVVCVIAGIGTATVAPSIARVLASRVHPSRLAPAQCVVAAGIPASSLLAGALIGLLIDPLGWRLTTVAIAVMALAVVLPVLRTLTIDVHGQGTSPSHSGQADLPTGLLALVTALGTGAMSVVTTFFGAHAAASGLAPATAGAILAGLSVTAIASRIGTGLFLAGDATRLFRIAAALVFGGGVGYATMATGGSLAFVAGAALVFAVGWAFLGVVLGATLVAAKDPGTSMSRVQVGLFAGPALAPLIYGPVFAGSGAAVADALAAVVAWSSAAGLLIAATRVGVAPGSRTAVDL